MITIIFCLYLLYSYIIDAGWSWIMPPWGSNERYPYYAAIISSFLLMMGIYLIAPVSMLNRLWRFAFGATLIISVSVELIFACIRLSDNSASGICYWGMRDIFEVGMKKNNSYLFMTNVDDPRHDNYYFGLYHRNRDTVNFYQVFPYPSAYYATVERDSGINYFDACFCQNERGAGHRMIFDKKNTGNFGCISITDWK